ncbi:MAG: DUF6600 domain-containing protein [Thermoanaerobaculia bacterium]
MKAGTGLRTLLALGAILLAPSPAPAQYEGEPFDDETLQAVARISWFEGDVSLNRGDDPDDWQPASVNYPVTAGDRLWTASGSRAELQLPGATLYLAPESELGALDLTRNARQVSLTLGTATVRLHRLDPDERFELATPNVSVTFESPGVYRVDVDEDGNTRVSVSSGRASAAAAGGQVALRSGDQIRVWGLDRPDYDVVGLARSDSWDRWVENRARKYRSVRPVSYVHPDIYGAEDLEAYGAWQSVPEYGTVWFPAVATSGWEPYRAGRWVWRDPWGWTWVSSEPWGWAPYHYGRWAVVRGRWCWVPVGPRSPHAAWSPALVAFVGGGAGWSVSVSGGGFVGWFPLAPGEPFSPWWRHGHPVRHEPDYRFAYRERATVVPREVFAGGRRIDRDVVRTSTVVREVAHAPVLNGPIPVLPTRDAIRAGEIGREPRGGPRPPEGIGRREVVTRTAPPPPPPTFDRKLELIRESGGEPVPVEVSRRLAVDEHRGAGPAQPARPAGRSEVGLSPRGEVEPSRQPQALPPSWGRPSAPADRTTPRREEWKPTPAPDVPREVAPERPTAAPRLGGAWNPEPTRAAPTPRSAWPEPTRPPARTFDRPETMPTPRSERMPVREPRVERTEPPAPPTPTAVRFRVPRDEPRVDVPRRGEVEGRDVPKPVRAEPTRVESRAAAPTKAPPNPTPTPVRRHEKRLDR